MHYYSSRETEKQTHIFNTKLLHFQNGNCTYEYLVLGHEDANFVKEHSDSKSKYSVDDIIKMHEFLKDIFLIFAGKVFQQIVGISIGTNCAPSRRHLGFIQSLLSMRKKHLGSISRTGKPMIFCP